MGAAIAAEVELPPGMYLDRQFEHELQTRRILFLILPLVGITIFVILYLTYHDLADTLIVMLLAVPGAIFGGVLFQYAFGYEFSVAVWVAFIACFGAGREGWAGDPALPPLGRRAAWRFGEHDVG